MTDAAKVGVHLDFTEKRSDLPDHDPGVRCSDHPSAPPEDGFGMAGGGFGIYTYCPECGRVLTKSEVES